MPPRTDTTFATVRVEGAILPVDRYIRDPDLLPKSDSARWFVLDCVRQFVRDGHADRVGARVVNRFLRSLSEEHQLLIVSGMVEKWGAIGGDKAMLDLLKKVTAA